MAKATNAEAPKLGLLKRKRQSVEYLVQDITRLCQRLQNGPAMRGGIDVTVEDVHQDGIVSISVWLRER